jgi:hypothetical protein
MNTEQDPLSDKEAEKCCHEALGDYDSPSAYGVYIAGWQECARRSEKWLQELDDDNEKLAIENKRLRELCKKLLSAFDRMPKNCTSNLLEEARAALEEEYNE